MSRVSAVSVDLQVMPGRYEVTHDWEPNSSNQVQVQVGDIVKLKEQNEERGWVWVTKIETQESGYLPRTRLKKISDGDLDQWAYGHELVSTFILLFGGLFVLLWGSATINGGYITACGTASICFSALTMLMIYMRNEMNPLYRGAGLVFFSVPMFVSYPLGLPGGIFVLLSGIPEYFVWRSGNERYKGEEWTFSGWCGVLFGNSFTSVCFFIVWCATCFGFFMVGYTSGEAEATIWTSVEQKDTYVISIGVWALTAGFGTVISWAVCGLLLVSLTGFQQILLEKAENMERGNRESCRAKMKKFLVGIFSEESIESAQKAIVNTIVVGVILHCLFAYFAYESSGSKRDFSNIFTIIPFITGAVGIILLALFISGAWIHPKRLPTHSKIYRGLGYLLIILMFFHGTDGWNEHFWKYVIVPVVFFLMDKMFRLGVWGYSPHYDDLEQQKMADFPDNNLKVNGEF